MSNDKISVITPIGTLVYPALNEAETYRGKTEFKTKIVFEPGQETADFIKQLDEFYDRYNVPEDYRPYGLDVDKETKEQTGNFYLNARLKETVEYGAGKSFTQRPKLYDSQKNPTTALIGSGSRARLGVDVVYSPRSESVALRLLAVQVIELVEGKGQREFDFAAVDGGFENEGEEYGF